MYSIGQLSKKTGVKVPTIRYYEDIGLLSSDRNTGNQRRYSSKGLERLSFIRHARDLGLSLDAIRELLALGADPGAPHADIHAITRAHLSDVQARIAKLKRLEKELKRIEANCHADEVGDCYVIEALADHDLCEREH